MKKLLLILPFLIVGLSVSARPSPETIRLFHETKISTMSLGLLFCKKVDEDIDCSFDAGFDKLFISSVLPETFGLNIGFTDKPILPRPSDIDRCNLVFARTSLGVFRGSWTSDKIRPALFRYNKFTEAFFERGLTTNQDGKKTNDSLEDWFARNLRIEVFLGNELWSDTKKNGLVCSFQLFKDEFLSIRKDNYIGFLEGLNE